MKRTSRKGFTLIELIVTIVILGILAALAVPAFQAVIERSRQNALVQGANGIAREAHALAAFEDAATVADVVIEVVDATAGTYAVTAELAADVPASLTVEDVTATGFTVEKGDYAIVVDLSDAPGQFEALTLGTVVASD